MSATLGTVYEFSKPSNEAEAPQPIPASEYRASVRAVEAKNSKNSGKPMAAFSYHVSAEQYPADFTDGDPDGVVLTFYLPLEDNARNRFRIRKHCEAHGVAATHRLNLPDFIGQEVIIKIEHEDYQGAPQARITAIRGV
jgi:hypothetical protein